MTHLNAMADLTGAGHYPLIVSIERGDDDYYITNSQGGAMTRTAASTQSLLTYYATAPETYQPDANPDGVYWQGGVSALQYMLKELIGAEDYRAWAEMVWPDDAIDSLTWKEIYFQLDRTIEAVHSGVDGVMNWADAAQYPQETPPACYGL